MSPYSHQKSDFNRERQWLLEGQSGTRVVGYVQGPGEMTEIKIYEIIPCNGKGMSKAMERE
jgi:hypothetical protein